MKRIFSQTIFGQVADSYLTYRLGLAGEKQISSMKYANHLKTQAKNNKSNFATQSVFPFFLVGI